MKTAGMRLLFASRFILAFICACRLGIQGFVALPVVSFEREKIPLLGRRKGQSATSDESNSKEKKETLYWRESGDEIIIAHPSYYNNDAQASHDMNLMRQTTKKLKLTVHGNPVPLRRHRTSRGFMYNPSAKSQQEFQGVVKDILSTEAKKMGQVSPTSSKPFQNTTSCIMPFFEENESISMNIVFRLKRPMNHFIGNKPGPGRIRPIHLKDDGSHTIRTLYPSRTDIDNLIKFVLDSMNGVLYVDDRQIVSLSSLRILDTDHALVADNERVCDGSTTFTLESFSEEDVASYLSCM